MLGWTTLSQHWANSVDYDQLRELARTVDKCFGHYYMLENSSPGRGGSVHRAQAGGLGAIVEEYLALVTGVIEETRPTNGPIRARDLSLLVMGIPASLAIRRRIGPDPALENRVRTLLLPFLVRCVIDETQGK